MFKEEEVQGLILNLVPITFKSEGKEDTHMTQITYALYAPSTERFKGYAVLTGYANGEAFTKLEKVVKDGVPVKFKIESRPNGNGSKFFINSVNGIPLK